MYLGEVVKNFRPARHYNVESVNTDDGICIQFIWFSHCLMNSEMQFELVVFPNIPPIDYTYP